MCFAGCNRIKFEDTACPIPPGALEYIGTGYVRGGRGVRKEWFGLNREVFFAVRIVVNPRKKEQRQ